MGKAVSTMLCAALDGSSSTLDCASCSKYVCNAMSIHSRCVDCCECDLVTEKVDVSDNDSEISFEVDSCCAYRRKS